MKILITSIVDLRNTAHNRLHELVKWLSQRHTITVLSINDWWKAGQTKTHLYTEGFEEALGNTTLHYFTTHKVSPVVQELTSPFSLRESLKNTDCSIFDVHVNYNTLVSGYFVAGRMKRLGIKTVYDIADHLPAMVRASPQLYSPLRPACGLLASLFVRRNIKTAEKITVTNRHLAESMRIAHNKRIFIPNGVDTDFFRYRIDSATDLRKRLNLGGRLVLGYVGVLREWVDLEPTFIAIEDLNHKGIPAKCLIVGEEGGLVANKLKAQKYGVADKVIFTGTVPYREVPDYLSSMDVCLLPFRNNVYSQHVSPLKLLEYMACEKPVIATASRSILEVAGDKILYARTADELTRVVRELHESPGLCEKLGKEGREFVKDNYSWRRVCSTFEQVLEETASLRR